VQGRIRLYDVEKIGKTTLFKQAASEGASHIATADKSDREF
jgi:hypothetical protein